MRAILRCTYCYTGDKLLRAMPAATGRKAIDRAIASLMPGGSLELGFFGGEPLIEAELIAELIEYAQRQGRRAGVAVELSMTTNGTIVEPTAWSVMIRPEMQLAISHDGLPEVHDRHRITTEGRPSSVHVLTTIARLIEAGKEFRAVMVVRPDNVASLPAGMTFLYERGVRRFDPSLDLWTVWTRRDGEVLKEAIRRCADFWAARLPDCGVSWLDEKVARFSGVPIGETARCGFGHSEIGVAPSGNLYPCERVIGADLPGNPLRLAGHVAEGDDFLRYAPAAGKAVAACDSCALNATCSTTCRCSNFVRTGDVRRPDGLLCLWDQACSAEAVRATRNPAGPDQLRCLMEESHDPRQEDEGQQSLAEVEPTPLDALTLLARRLAKAMVLIGAAAPEWLRWAPFPTGHWGHALRQIEMAAARTRDRAGCRRCPSECRRLNLNRPVTGGGLWKTQNPINKTLATTSLWPMCPRRRSSDEADRLAGCSSRAWRCWPWVGPLCLC